MFGMYGKALLLKLSLPHRSRSARVTVRQTHPSEKRLADSFSDPGWQECAGVVGGLSLRQPFEHPPELEHRLVAVGTLGSRSLSGMKE